MSFAIALLNHFDSAYLGISANDISAVLAIALPVVTAYIVFRTPERLWILEISTRNKLRDLGAKIEFEMSRNANFDQQPFEAEFFGIMHDANEKWLAAKG